MLKILIIAGFDPTGKAGFLRDAQTCCDLQNDYFVIPTAWTIQNDFQFILSQSVDLNHFKTLWQQVDFSQVGAIKIGMLASEPIVDFLCCAIKDLKQDFPHIQIIWDPVFVASSGGKLLSFDGFVLAQKELLSLVDIVTPNAYEFLLLSHSSTQYQKLWEEGLSYSFLDSDLNKISNIKKSLEDFYSLYKTSVYLKGGHLPKRSEDYFYDGKEFFVFDSSQSSKKIRGTGCLFSMALACYVNQEFGMTEACKKAKEYVTRFFN